MADLTASGLARAAEFMRTEARPIDRARFRHHFEEAPASAVLDELARYQNADGGFGRGLEPDFTLPDSSGMAACIAFQILREIEAGPDEPLVRRGIELLVASYDSQLEGWLAVPPGVDGFPRAPWWDFKPPEGALDHDAWGMPGAELTGYLNRYSDLVPADLVARTTETALRHLDRSARDMDVHTLVCYARLGETAPDPAGEQVRQAVTQVVHSAVSSDTSSWESYGGRPLWFAPTPDSFLADELREGVDRQLDFEIEHQSSEGCWEPFWEWGRFEDAWKAAKVHWRGNLTMENLLALKAWGRIEGL